MLDKLMPSLVVLLIACGWAYLAYDHFWGSSEVVVEYCGAACAAQGAGYAFAKHFHDACEAAGEDFKQGCSDFFEDLAHENDDPPED